MMTAEKLEAKARGFERLLGSVEADAPRHEELAAKLADRDTDMGADMAAHVRRITSRTHIEMVVGRIRWFVRDGELERAEQAVINFENHWAAIKDMHFEVALKSRQGTKIGGKKGGEASKRRVWADILAEHLAQRTTSKDEAWELIPEPPNRMIELESNWDDFKIYRDGDEILCIENENEKERKLARSTFFRRYFPPKGQQAP